MKKFTNVFIKSTIILLIVLALVRVVQLNYKVDELSSQADQLKEQVNEKQLDVEELRQKERADLNREFIIKIAREKLGYKMPGEVVYYNDLFK